jgi:cardiolipin synthase
MHARHIPNIISAGRIVLVYPVVAFMLAGQFDRALALFVIAGLSDALDGLLAKRFHWQSRLGSYLDPVADKLLLMASYVSLAWLGLIPHWLAALVVLRDAIIFGGAAAYYFLLHPFEGQPSRISKLNTLLQLLLVVAILIREGLGVDPDGVIAALIAITTLTTVASGVSYVGEWGGRYVRETRGG